MLQPLTLKNGVKISPVSNSPTLVAVANVPSDGTTHTGYTSFNVELFSDGTSTCPCEDSTFRGDPVTREYICKHGVKAWASVGSVLETLAISRLVDLLLR